MRAVSLLQSGFDIVFTARSNVSKTAQCGHLWTQKEIKFSFFSPPFPKLIGLNIILVTKLCFLIIARLPDRRCRRCTNAPSVGIRKSLWKSTSLSGWGVKRGPGVN